MAPHHQRLQALEGHMTDLSNMATELEQALAQGVQDAKVPHAVVYATNKDGTFTYHHATGFHHYGSKQADSSPIQPNALFMLASASKLFTAIAALKAVELGFLTLEEDVCPHLPELASKQVLHGFDEATSAPILKPRQNPITLTHLLAHSSGHTYSFHPDIIKYVAVTTGQPAPMSAMQATIVERYDTPLAFEPGTSWAYSPGLDWTGLLIQRVTGLTLEEFEQKHLWQPLGITELTFWPSAEKKNVATPQLCVRGKEDTLVPFEGETINTHSTECFGGHGMYANLADYILVLQSLLANDGKLLLPTSVEALFTPQLGAESKTALNEFIQTWHTMIPGDWNPNIPTSYALGGIVFLEDDVGRRKKGTLSWGGLFNSFWMVDRESDVAYCFGTQVLPPGDKGCKEMCAVAERAVYKMAGKA